MIDMKSTLIQPNLDLPEVPVLPRWITRGSSDLPDEVAFVAGAALSHLDLVLKGQQNALPMGVFCDRLAMRAAMACLKLEGRSDSEAVLRDAVCLTRAGDAYGPSGDMFVLWRKVVHTRLSASKAMDHMIGHFPPHLAKLVSDLNLFRRRDGTPFAQAGAVLSEIISAAPHNETFALMLADVVLSREMGWSYTVPLLGPVVSRGNMHNMISDPSLTPQILQPHVIPACDRALQLANDVLRRAHKITAITPKLRSKAATDAVHVFLTYDAVSPSTMLSPRVFGTKTPMTDRAARRLCDRLVELGVARELTGRSSFRLYGL